MSKLIVPGRDEGWLSLPLAALPAWAQLNNVDTDSVKIDRIPGRGSAIIAHQALPSDRQKPLMTVPRDLILSLESVRRHALSDQKLRQVLDAVGDYGKTPRGAMMIFLLLQATIACPHTGGVTGVKGPFTEYVKFFPDELLPTFWTETELGLLQGTTLKAATDAKLRSLSREFSELCASTEEIAWCKEAWWDEVDGFLSFEDWKHLDAMYRSRGLDFPNLGHAMIPCLDMANHASGSRTIARFDTDRDGNATLLMWSPSPVEPGDEITITYGDDKGACEMLFSYGFVEEGMPDAKALFLDLAIPEDDPLKRPKLAVSNAAPGVRIFRTEDGPSWESDFVWLVCVNEEDGLAFQIQQTIDGGREVKALWQGDEREDMSSLRKLLEADRLWPIYLLRAVCIIQDRVAEQLEGLRTRPEDPSIVSGDIRDRPRALASTLCKLEGSLLEGALSRLEDQKMQLAEDEVVKDYLGRAQSGDMLDEDFS